MWKGPEIRECVKFLQTATTPRITAPAPRRSQWQTSGQCWCGPQVKVSPALQEHGESERDQQFPDERICQDYPLRPSVLPLNSHLDTFRFWRSWLLVALTDLHKWTTVTCRTLSQVRRSIERDNRLRICGVTEVFPPQSQSPNASLWGISVTLGFGGSWLLGARCNLSEWTCVTCEMLSRVRRGIPWDDRSGIRGVTEVLPPQSQSPYASLWGNSTGLLVSRHRGSQASATHWITDLPLVLGRRTLHLPSLCSRCLGRPQSRSCEGARETPEGQSNDRGGCMEGSDAPCCWGSHAPSLGRRGLHSAFPSSLSPQKSKVAAGGWPRAAEVGTCSPDWDRWCGLSAVTSVFEGDEHLGGTVAPSLGQWCTFTGEKSSEGPLSDVSPRNGSTHFLLAPSLLHNQAR